MTRRPLPPFGRILQQRIADRSNWHRWWGCTATGLSVFVVTGVGAWNWARWRLPTRLVLVAPPGTDPEAYDWRLLAGHDPILLMAAGQTDGEHVRRLVIALMGAGISRVLDLRGGGTLYRRASSQEAA